MFNKNIAIVLNGNKSIGFGHFYRCLQVENAFKKICPNCEITYLTYSKEIFQILIEKRKHVVELLDFNRTDYEFFFKSIINKLCIDIILFDLLEEALVKHSFLINSPEIFISSISTFEYTFERFEDLTIYPGLGQNIFHQIKGLNSKQVKFFGGSQYLTIREEFCMFRKTDQSKEARNILITMGGTDPENFTEKVINSIKLIPFKVTCKILLGHSNSQIEKVNNLVADSIHNFEILNFSDEIPSIMQSCDIAIINGGLTRYECVVIGLPFIAISIHDLQFSITELITKHGSGINLGVGSRLSIEEISIKIAELLNDYQLRFKLVSSNHNAIDCKGAERIADCILFNFNSKI